MHAPRKVPSEDRLSVSHICDLRDLAIALIEKCTTDPDVQLYNGEDGQPRNVDPVFAVGAGGWNERNANARSKCALRCMRCVRPRVRAFVPSCVHAEGTLRKTCSDGQVSAVADICGVGGDATPCAVFGPGSFCTICFYPLAVETTNRKLYVRRVMSFFFKVVVRVTRCGYCVRCGNTSLLLEL